MDPTFRGLSVPVPKSNKPGHFPVKMVLLIIGFLVFVMVAFVTISSFFEDNSAYAPLQLSLRMDTAAKMSKDATQNIKDPALSKVNSEIANVLSSDNGEILRLLPAAKNDPTSKSYRNAERARALKLTDELKTAKINGIFDDKYKATIREEIANLQKAAKRLVRRTGGEFKVTLEKFISHADSALSKLDSL